MIKILTAFTFAGVLFATTITEGLAQVPIATFTATGLRTNEVVGYSVATDGQLVFIGTGAGSAFLYNPFTKQQLAKVTVPDPRFSTSVALQGTTAVLGTWGHAYMYDFSDLSHIVTTELFPDDGAVELFGVSVDISGDTVIVGANGENSAGSFTGAAYLFHKNTHAQFAKLTANDRQASDNFGVAVAIDGNSAAVGSVLASSGSGNRRGAVYLFNADPAFVGNRQLAKYPDPPGNSSSHPQFGYNVDISGDTIIALEPVNGQSFLWPTSGTPIAIPDSRQSRNAGDGLNIQDGHAIVGYPTDDKAILYNLDRSPLGYAVSPESSAASFGFSVALGNNLVVIGAPEASGGGATYVYLIEDLIPEPGACTLLFTGFAMVACRFRKRPV
jgi:hypothetical protein